MNSKNPLEYICLVSQHHPKIKKMTNQQQQTTMVSKLDMLRQGSIHFDIFECNVHGILMQIVYLPEQFVFLTVTPKMIF